MNDLRRWILILATFAVVTTASVSYANATLYVSGALTGDTYSVELNPTSTAGNSDWAWTVGNHTSLGVYHGFLSINGYPDNLGNASYVTFNNELYNYQGVSADSSINIRVYLVKNHTFNFTNISWNHDPCRENATQCVYTGINKTITNVTGAWFEYPLNWNLTDPYNQERNEGLYDNIYFAFFAEKTTNGARAVFYSSDYNTTGPYARVAVCINDGWGCVSINGTTTTTVISAEAQPTYDYLNNGFKWIGEILTGGNSAFSMVEVGKMVVWLIIMLAIPLFSTYKGVNLPAGIWGVLEIALLVVGAWIGFIPVFIGIIITVFAMLVMGYMFRDIFANK